MSMYRCLLYRNSSIADPHAFNFNSFTELGKWLEKLERGEYHGTIRVRDTHVRPVWITYRQGSPIELLCHDISIAFTDPQFMYLTLSKIQDLLMKKCVEYIRYMENK